jgi:hypothetical protein
MAYALGVTMFEKEAKEYEDSYIKSDYCERVRDTWRNGAVFGYTKASEWHDLRKDPNDLPPVERGSASIDVLTDGKGIAYYYYDESCWCDFNGSEIDPPKAWCEIPKFEEEIK